MTIITKALFCCGPFTPATWTLSSNSLNSLKKYKKQEITTALHLLVLPWIQSLKRSSQNESFTTQKKKIEAICLFFGFEQIKCFIAHIVPPSPHTVHLPSHL